MRSDPLPLPKRQTAGLAVFFAALLFSYAVTFTGFIGSGDNMAQYHQTVRMLDHGRFSFSAADVLEISQENDWHADSRFLLNKDGKTYSQMYHIGDAVLSLPLFAVTRGIKHAMHLNRPADSTLWSANAVLFMALSVALLAGVARRAGVTGWTGLSIVLAAAFASPFWMYSDIPFNVVGEALLICAGIALCLAPVTRRSSAAFGLVLVWGVAMRPFFASAIPAFLFLFGQGLMRPENKKRLGGNLAAFFFVSLLGAGCWAFYNFAHFGSITETGYANLGSSLNFQESWPRRIADIFLNPIKSPFYFFPLCVLFVPAFVFLVVKKDPVWIFIAAFSLPHIYWMPKISFWDNGTELFLRYWLRLVPVIFLTLIYAASYQLPRGWRVACAAMFIVLAVLGFRSQALTALTNQRAAYDSATERINAEHPGMIATEYHDAVARLFLGDTAVAKFQVGALSAPRRFLIFREIPPQQRLFLLLPGLVGCLAGLRRFFKMETT